MWPLDPVQDVRAYRGADCASDYNLVIAKTLLKLNRAARRTVQVRRYETSKLNVPEIRKQFQLELKNRFSCLVVEDDCDENRLEDEGEVARENEGPITKAEIRSAITSMKAGCELLNSRHAQG